MKKIFIGSLIATSLTINCWLFTKLLDNQQNILKLESEIISTSQSFNLLNDELTVTRENLTQLLEELSDVESRYESLEAKYRELEKKQKATSITRGGNLYQNSVPMIITAYTHTGQPTKSGKMPIVGRTIAVDPRIIPMGTRVYIEGVGYRIAEDTGGDIKGNRIDLFMDSEKECVIFGRKNLKVIILK